jgi:hypothetical protein
MIMKTIDSFCLTLLLVSAVNLPAQTYSIDWFSIDSGGGTSTGGLFSVTGTIGQPDAGAAMTGDNYSVVGGFWSIFAVQTPGAPLLWVARAGNYVVISWPAGNAGGFLLDQATALSGSPIPWTQVPFPYATNGAVISVTNSSPTGTRYYRLRKP